MTTPYLIAVTGAHGAAFEHTPNGPARLTTVPGGVPCLAFAWEDPGDPEGHVEQTIHLRGLPPADLARVAARLRALADALDREGVGRGQ
jgi:hypothetical protein